MTTRDAAAKLRHVFRAPAELDAATRMRMLELMHLCYDNVDDARFAHDLANKQHVICLMDEKGTAQGFSTIRIAEETLGGKRVDILFSGDTVIHPDWWGTKALQPAFLAFTLRHKLKNLRRPLYWLLLSKGYKSYLLLTNNFPNAFPRRGGTPPPALVALRDRVARAWWGTEYDERTEIVSFAVARDRVKPGVASLDPATLAQPDVAYFVERNPRWSDGDELVCFAEIDFGFGTRWFGKQARRFLGLAPHDAAAVAPVMTRLR